MRYTMVPVLAVAAALAGGCGLVMGQDGQPGKAYIAYTWVSGPITFATEDPAFAGQSLIYNGEYRETTPGTYEFAYVAWDDSVWEGSYTIYVDPGQPGELFRDGADGEDLYFELSCLSFGATLYVWDEDWAYRATRARGIRGLDRERARAAEAGQRLAAHGDAGFVTSTPPLPADLPVVPRGLGGEPDVGPGAGADTLEHRVIHRAQRPGG